MLKIFSNRVEWMILVVFAGCGFFAPQASAQVSNWVPIEVKNGHVYMDSSIGGIPGRALIDTGAEINGINEQFLESSELEFEQGSRMKVAGVYDTAFLNTYRDVPVTVFDTDLDFANLVGINFSDPSVQLIIGAGFLKLFIFQFDYPNQRMRIISRDSLDLGKASNVRSRKDQFGSSPIIRVRLNDERNAWLLMDTGYNGGVMLGHIAGSRWLDRFETVESTTRGINSFGRMQDFTLPAMTIGDFEIQNPSVSVLADGSNTRFDPPQRNSTSGPVIRNTTVGILGYEILKHFIVTVDYQSGRVHLEPEPVAVTDIE